MSLHRRKKLDLGDWPTDWTSRFRQYVRLQLPPRVRLNFHHLPMYIFNDPALADDSRSQRSACGEQDPH